MNLALFDFDGTVTREDTFSQFLFYATPRHRKVLGFALIWPLVLLYKLGLFPACRLRPILSRLAYGGRRVDELTAIAERFVDGYLPTVMRPEALKALASHKAQGDEIYLVSATLDVYLAIFCQQQGINLLCSRLEVKNGRFTGRYLDGDCSGDRKAKAVKQAVTLTDYPTIYAYGDTHEDHEMLALADVKYYCWQRLS